MKKNKVTFALTSCGRFDLLRLTLDSFMSHNKHPIERYVVYDDSGKPIPFKSDYQGIEFIEGRRRIGQVRAIDTMYSTIDTEYIFHCEDDWIFTRSGFIEESMEILEANDDILLVWLRDHTDTNNHPVIKGEQYSMMERNYIWHGFTWNPALRRLKDYQTIGSYGAHTRFDRNNASSAEKDIDNLYFRNGFSSAILNNKATEHIGWGRHIGK